MLIHEILPVGVLGCNCSIIGDDETREAIVIDPGDNIPDILAILARHQLKVTSIVITHAHIDHIGGAAKLKKATGAPVLMNEADQFLYDNLETQADWIGVETPARTKIDASLRDGDSLNLASTKLEILHTPGHTQGSTCVWIPSANKLIAGDTLFRESIGRTDLPGGDYDTIIASIKNKLLELPEETVVYPGHGPATTLAHEREYNPFLD